MHCNAHVQYKVYFFRAVLRVELLHVQFDTLKPYVYKIKPQVTVVGFFFSQSPNLLFYRMDCTYMFLSDCIFQLYIIIQTKTHAHQYFFFLYRCIFIPIYAKKKKKTHYFGFHGYLDPVQKYFYIYILHDIQRVWEKWLSDMNSSVYIHVCG